MPPGRGNPTIATPGRTIEFAAACHDDGVMEWLLALVVGTLVTPVVVVPAALVAVTLLSGVGARLAEWWEIRTERRSADVLR